MQRESYDILVIGAGQAGLALAYHLQSTPFHFHLLERHPRIGESWRRRYQSLVLFTPRMYDSLPGLPMPGDPQGYPCKDEVADYLEMYASHFRLPISLGVSVTCLEKTDTGFCAITSDHRLIESRMVVLATGAFQKPRIPQLAFSFAPDVVQFTTETYQAPAQIPAGPTLVVGDGMTGRQIALELGRTHPVTLATGRPRTVGMQKFLGRDSLWWMDQFGLLNPTRESWFGRLLIRYDPFPGQHLKLKAMEQRGVRLVGRLVDAEARTATFEGGEQLEIVNLIWATGYQDQADWIKIDGILDDQGRFAHQRGQSPVSGLYHIGREWQWTRGSASLGGVGEDACYLVNQMISNIS